LPSAMPNYQAKTFVLQHVSKTLSTGCYAAWRVEEIEVPLPGR